MIINPDNIVGNIVDDIVVRRLINFDEPHQDIYIVSYFKNGHNAMREFTSTLYTGKQENNTSSWVELMSQRTQDNKPDNIIYIIRDPFERLLSGIKERILHKYGYTSLLDDTNSVDNFENNNWRAKYTSRNDVITMLHDYNFWETEVSNDFLNDLKKDKHTRNYLETFNILIKETISNSTVLNINNMSYWFAQKGYRVPHDHKTICSPLVNLLIIDVLNNNLSRGDDVKLHLKNEYKHYEALRQLESYNNNEETTNSLYNRLI